GKFDDAGNLALQRSLLRTVLGFELIRISVVLGFADVVDDGAGARAPGLRTQPDRFVVESDLAQLLFFAGIIGKIPGCRLRAEAGERDALLFPVHYRRALKRTGECDSVSQQD